MGTKRNDIIADVKLYDDVKNPETSQYDVLNLKTVPSAVVDPVTKTKLSDTLADYDEKLKNIDTNAINNAVNNANSAAEAANEAAEKAIRGSRWNVGTAITGTFTLDTQFPTGISDSMVNDLYLNIDTGNVYRCSVSGDATTARWVYVGNIKGAKGATGDPGPKGDTGSPGVPGTNGVTPTIQASAGSNINSVGTPTVTADTSGTTTTFTFDYLKGDPGPQGPAGSDANITVDTSLSLSSTNPVQNKVIYEELLSKMFSEDPTGTGILSVNRKEGSSAGRRSVAIGDNPSAVGDYSFACGGATQANGATSFACGGVTYANGDYSFSCGMNGTKAEGRASFAGGITSTATGNHSFAFGNKAQTLENNAVAFGSGSTAEGSGSMAIGSSTTAVGEFSFAGGSGSTASKSYSFAFGKGANAKGLASFACGYETTADGSDAFACGRSTTANGDYSFACGKYNNDTDSPSGWTSLNALFTIGWGSDGSPSNAFRVSSSGNVYATSSSISAGADYGEYVRPWFDDNVDNEDRRGYLVTVRDGKLYKAEPGDYIIGVTSGNPSVIGNGDEDWTGRWERDEFNQLKFQDIEVDDYKTVTDDDGNATEVKMGSHIEKHRIQSKIYDPSQKYIERKDRPEWSVVGMVGVVPLRDDGTCIPGGYAKCKGYGIATRSNDWFPHETFFVIDRINDHIVNVLVK